MKLYLEIMRNHTPCTCFHPSRQVLLPKKSNHAFHQFYWNPPLLPIRVINLNDLLNCNWFAASACDEVNKISDLYLHTVVHLMRLVPVDILETARRITRRATNVCQSSPKRIMSLPVCFNNHHWLISIFKLACLWFFLFVIYDGKKTATRTG